MIDEAGQFLKSIQKDKQQSFELLTLHKLMSKEIKEAEWIIPDFFIQSGVSLLCGKPKTGKSTLVRNIALSIASKDKFFSRPVVNGSVLYLALEEIESQVKESFKLLGANGPEPIYLHIGPLKNGLAHLKEAIEKYNPVFVIVDPLFRLLKVRDLNDYSEVTGAMEELISIARRFSTHICLCHHMNKASDNTGGILGSTALFGAVDAVLMMRRTTEASYLSTRMRYGRDLKEVALEFDEESRSFQLGRTKLESDIDKAKGQIISLLEKSDKSKTEAEITVEISGSTSAKRYALRRLLSSGKIKRFGKGGKSEPYHYRTLKHLN